MVLGKWLSFTRKPLVKIKRIKKKNSDIIAFLSTVDAKIEKKKFIRLKWNLQPQAQRYGQHSYFLRLTSNSHQQVSLTNDIQACNKEDMQFCQNRITCFGHCSSASNHLW